MYNEKIVNILTGEEILRDYSKEEIVEVKKAQAEAEKRIEEFRQRDVKRQSALAKLIDLGLTEEEIAAL